MLSYASRCQRISNFGGADTLASRTYLYPVGQVRMIFIVSQHDRVGHCIFCAGEVAPLHIVVALPFLEAVPALGQAVLAVVVQALFDAARVVGLAALNCRA